ncbi:MAG TPA: insulinase family protein, partial [Pyrinomonadaceae bacterium]|nr:insulinase family protein [Pyrinomonadaceae bacterium]
LLESVATAVSNPTIDRETTAKLKGKRLEKIAELRKDPAYLAQLAAAKQLFGTFPYGRAELGTAESVSKIEFPDLLDAKQRFLTADNATVSIAGKIDTALAYRAARRYLGSWLKSDKMTPSTFRQPDEPDTKMVKVTSEVDSDPYIGFAMRGLARNDKDYAASEVLTHILESRLKANVSTSKSPVVFVDNSARFLPGDIEFGFTAAEGSEPPNNLVTLLLSKAIGNDEFTSAKAQANNTVLHTATDEKWLDVDTYKLTSAADEQKAFESVTLADVQRVAERLAKNPVVSVSVNKADKPATAN